MARGLRAPPKPTVAPRLEQSRGTLDCVQNRVLVRLNPVVPTSAEEMNEALAHGRTWNHKYRSPGIEETQRQLESLERSGLARREGEGWVLTAAGDEKCARLEDMFDSSNGYGDYGF